MAATATLATLASDLTEELDLGIVLTAATGDTTTITETSTGESEISGPFTGAKIPIGSPVMVITGGTVGEDTWVSNFEAPGWRALPDLPAGACAAVDRNLDVQ